jgi:hypothetical protein
MKLTPEQLKKAAYEYCRLMKLDPEQSIGHSPPPNEDGSVYLSCRWSPQWKIVADELNHYCIIKSSIEYGLTED